MKDSPETSEQKAFFQWICLNKRLRHCIFSIPNEAKRSILECQRLKSMGLRPGVSDLFIAYPTSVYHGLFIEMKAKKKGSNNYNKPTSEQLLFCDDMWTQGYAAVICNGSDMAINVTQMYLNDMDFCKYRKWPYNISF